MIQNKKFKWLKLRTLLIVVVALFGLGCAGYKWVSFDGVTQIQDIRIKGLTQLNLADVKEVMNVDLQTSWEDVNVEEIEVSIMNLDRVESVQATMGVDRILEIEIQESYVVALNYDKGWCRIYSNGYRDCSQGEVLNVPIIKVIDQEEVSWNKIASYLVELKSVNPEIYKDLSMLVAEAHQAEAHFVSHAMKVKISLKEENPWKKYNYLLDHFSQNLMKKQVLDLRFEGYAYAS